MPLLIKFNNKNFRCKNCQSPECILRQSNDKVMIYYECLNCGEKYVTNFNYAPLLYPPEYLEQWSKGVIK